VRVCLVACSLAACSSGKGSDCICSEIRLQFLKALPISPLDSRTEAKLPAKPMISSDRRYRGRKHWRGEGPILPAESAVVECPLLRKKLTRIGHPRIPPLSAPLPGRFLQKQRATSGTALLARPTPASRKSLRTCPWFPYNQKTLCSNIQS
jgi:hypothetical protein